jgi:hypothetical protein
LTFDVGRFLLDLLRGLGGRVGFLGRLLRLTLQRVDLARQFLDLLLLLPNDGHQLGIALRHGGFGRQSQNQGRASRRKVWEVTVGLHRHASSGIAGVKTRARLRTKRDGPHGGSGSHHVLLFEAWQD